MNINLCVLDTSDFLPRIYLGESDQCKVKLTISACPPYDNEAKRDIANMVFNLLMGVMPESSQITVRFDRIEAKVVETPRPKTKPKHGKNFVKCERIFNQWGWTTQ